MVKCYVAITGWTRRDTIDSEMFPKITKWSISWEILALRRKNFARVSATGKFNLYGEIGEIANIIRAFSHYLKMLLNHSLYKKKLDLVKRKTFHN